MKIAVMCSDLGIRVPADKGASLHLQAITAAFAAIGHDVLLVSVAGHQSPPDIGVEYLLLDHPGRTSGLRREVRKIRFSERFRDRARPALVQFAPDVIYERLSLFGTAGHRLARELRVPHAVEVNALLAREESTWRGLRLGRLARHRERMVLTQADLRVAVSKEWAAEVDALGPGSPTRVVTNGVDTAALAQLPPAHLARRAFGLPPDAFLIGFSGALRPWHGLENAIDALVQLPSDCHLAVAGDGPVRQELERRAESLGVAKRITWLGQVRHAEMPAFLAGLDVAVAPYPALREFSFSPLKVFEYLGAGVPTVASDIGQLRELLGGGRGQLVPPGDAAALAHACREIRHDPAVWRESAATARREILADHGWNNRATQITGYLEEVTYAMAR
jgi:glycosyltransferase involved in cell wall biosynthesis